MDEHSRQKHKNTETLKSGSDPAPAGKVVLFLFFLSGACGLIYEVLWVRMLGLVFGNTTQAISIVLAAFMAGLAVGSWYFGRLVDTQRSNGRGYFLRLFGSLMLGIGIYCAFSPVLFKLIEWVYINLSAYQFVSLHFVRFLLAFIIVLIPTALMGGTLPVLSAYFIGRDLESSARDGSMSREHIGFNIGLLYSVNTGGAVLGAFAAGYILIMLLGVQGTLYATAGINLAIAGIVFFVLRSVERKANAAVLSGRICLRHDIAADSPLPASRSSLLVLGAIALSGFTALTYEVAWTRVLSMVLGSSVYAFATMLCAFLAGIAIGSMLYARFSGRGPLRVLANFFAQTNSITFFGFIQAGIGVSVLLLIPIFGVLPFAFLHVFKIFGAHFAGFHVFQFLLIFSVMLIPTTLFGMTIPLACKLYAGKFEIRNPKSPIRRSSFGIGQSVGNVYAANTIGAIVGSMLAGFALIPLIGLQKTITVVAMINVGLALVLFHVGLKERKWARGMVSCCLLFFVIPYAIAVPQWNKKVFVSGMYQYAPDFFDERYTANQSITGTFGRDTKSSEFLFYKEGKNFTVSVEKKVLTGVISLRIDGKTDASSSYAGDMINQVLLGQLPLLLYNSVPGDEKQLNTPEKVMVIGLGSGVTLGAVTLHPVEEIDCLEIEPAMVEASGYFDEYNHKPLEDNRVNLVIDDARNYLLTTDKRYDCIISEPSNPWMSGQSNLFTEEFFHIIKDSLEEDGIFCQWLQLYRLTPEMYKTVLKTFQSVFPHTSVWATGHGDTLIIATPQSLKIDYTKMVTNFQNKQIKDDLARIYIKNPLSLLVRMVLSEDTVRELSSQAKLHTDNFPRLEYSSAKSILDLKVYSAVVSLLRENYEAISPYLENFSDNKALVQLYIQKELYGAALSELKHRSSDIKDDIRHDLFGQVYANTGNNDEAEKEYRRAVEINPEFYSAWINLSRVCMRNGKLTQVEDILKYLIKKNITQAHSEMGHLYMYQGKPERAVKEFEKAKSYYPQDLGNYLALGRIYIDFLEVPPGALIVLEEARKRFPGSPEIYFLLGKSLVMMNLTKQAQGMFDHCMAIDRSFYQKIVQFVERSNG